MFRHVPIEEFVDACKRIDPDTDDLRGKAKALMDTGPFLTLAMAIAQIADHPAGLRKPVGSAPTPDTCQSRSA